MIRALLFALLIASPAYAGDAIPTLYGDGMHDDTSALQALFCGEAVRTNRVVAQHTLRGGTFRLSGQVVMFPPWRMEKVAVITPYVQFTAGRIATGRPGSAPWILAPTWFAVGAWQRGSGFNRSGARSDVSEDACGPGGPVVS